MSVIGLGLSANIARGILRLLAAHRLGGGQPVSEPASPTRLLVQGGWGF